jgi:ABC-2 type transport system ATP-binding protein
MITADKITTLNQASPPAGPNGAAIEINDLVVSYGPKRAVDGLTLAVPSGAIYGFLGPNGAGKTTTIKALLGMRKPNSGGARVLGYDIVSQSTELRARTGYVSEANSLYDNLTVQQMNDFYRSTARKWNQPRVDRYIQMFGLPVRSKVRQLSNGMKRQLALSLAVGCDPDLLILDEPTSGLDPIARHELLNKLVGEIAAEGTTIFFSSHVLSEVEVVADWIGIIRAGKLVVSDELDHLKQSHKVVKLVYAEAPTPAEIQALRALPGVGQVEQEGRSVRLVTRKDAEAVARQIRESFPALRDLEIVDLNLEDLFLEYMKEDTVGR